MNGPHRVPGGPLEVAVIDPSLFTIPYDDALCDALAAADCRPTLFGRQLRESERRAGRAPFEPFFYRFVERRVGAVPVRALRLAKGIEHAADMLRLRRLLARCVPDVIHFQWAPLPLIDRHVVPAMRRIAPTVLTVHDTTPFNGSPNEKLQAIGAAAIYHAFDHLVVLTEGGKAHLVARGIPAETISVIPHGPLEMPPRSIEARAGATEERIVLAFGKIKPYKGVDLLIEAFAQLPAALKARARLHFVGEPFMAIEPLQARAAALGIADRVCWDLRYVRDEEIGGIIDTAALLAFPYRQIDMSGVLMVALGYGKPIVASAVGAFAELLRDGEHGRLVPPGNVAALRDALAELLADPVRAAAMGENVRRIGNMLTSWSDIAEMTLAMYRMLIERHRGEAQAARQSRPRSAAV